MIDRIEVVDLDTKPLPDFTKEDIYIVNSEGYDSVSVEILVKRPINEPTTYKKHIRILYDEGDTEGVKTLLYEAIVDACYRRAIENEST